MSAPEPSQTALLAIPLPNPVAPVCGRLLNQRGTSVAERSTPRKPLAPNTCSGCPSTWTGSAAAHCSGCHTTWSGVGLFDRHRSVAGEHGTCTPPEQLVDGNGRPICELRDGMWRYPEMDEAAKAARFGARA